LNSLKNPAREWAEEETTEILLFRKPYRFRSVNPNPLTYLQFVDDLGKRKDISSFIKNNIREPNIDEKIKRGEHFNITKLPYDLGKEMYIKRMKTSSLRAM
jgi:hypothetical protein